MSKTKLTLREADAEDSELVVKCVQNFYRERPEELNFQTDKQLAALVKKLLSKSKTFYYLIFCKESPVGLVQLSDADKELVELILIYLLPAYRGQGLGSCALQKVIGLLSKRGVKYMKTEVHVNNSRSKHLFSNFGFKRHSNIFLKEL